MQCMYKASMVYLARPSMTYLARPGREAAQFHVQGWAGREQSLQCLLLQVMLVITTLCQALLKTGSK